MKKFAVSLLMCLLALQAFAGGGALLEIADDQFSRLAFTKAAEYYKKYLARQTDDIYAMKQLAACYDLLNDYENLEPVLADLVRITKNTDPEATLAYAEILQIKGKFYSAAEHYRRFLDIAPDDERAANQLIAAVDCYSNEDSTGFPKYIVRNMDFNTGSLDYAPNIFSKTIVYTSTTGANNSSGKTDRWTGGTFSDLKMHRMDSSSAPSFLENMGQLNTTYNDGPSTIDPLTGQLLYTRNNFDSNKTFARKGLNIFNYMNLKIYSADLKDGVVGSIHEFPYNSADYNTAHPTISPDGKIMVFVGDKPGEAIGQRDLYFCQRGDAYTWGKPVLLSKDINTEGDELFPYFHSNGMLYFSSDGLGSVGGLDIFRAEMDFENNTVVSVERLEADINSTYDDFGIVFTGDRSGFFTSDRPGGRGADDIYSFADNTILLRGLVVDSKTREPVPYSEVKVSGQKLEVFTGDTDGSGIFETYVQRGKHYDLWADNEYYYEGKEELSTTTIDESVPFEVTIQLQPVVYKVTVLDAGTRELIKGAELDIEFECNKPGESIVIGATGSHTVPVYKECRYNFKAKADGYLAKSYSWMSPPEDRDENIIIDLDPITFEPIVLRNIYYDFDKADLRLDESLEELTKIFTFLIDNPELTVQINSHTDSRGSKSYNSSLSQRRAQSVVDWLITKQIPVSRLVAAGYGEEIPVNNCTDGVKCGEEQHQMNRRTEFQVVNADGSTEIESENRQDVKTDPCEDCPF